MLTEAGIASSGTADSFLKALHLSRTRHVHQVTALALAKLQDDAFLHTEREHSEEAKEAWRQEMVEKSNIPILGYSSQHGTPGSHLHQITQ